MPRTWQDSTTEIAKGRLGYGAELPLLHPRLLLQLSNGEDGRMLLAAVCFALAIGAGVTIGWV